MRVRYSLWTSYDDIKANQCNSFIWKEICVHTPKVKAQPDREWTNN